MTKPNTIKWVFLFLCLFMIHSQVKSQDEKMKSIFVYNFTRYVSWPPKQGNFVIYILGKSPISAELQSISTKKKVGETSIEVKNVATPEEIADGHVVYITASKTAVIPSVVSGLQQKNILIISEKEGACKNGSAINFVNKEGKLTFEIEKNNLQKSGLKASSELFGLGTVIGQ